MVRATAIAVTLAAGALAQQVENPHKAFRREFPKRQLVQPNYPAPRTLEDRQNSPYLTPATQKFAVDGANFPGVPFDFGESYAGLLPIDNSTNSQNELFFWFFPSKNPAASNEVTIWLNGGPGCSSLDGLLQEHGPFMWQSGTYAPMPNPFSWTNLTNMIYVDQPVGTGLSQSAPGTAGAGGINNEVDVGRDFAGFWKNFMTTFGLQHRKVYITGESYAGQYIPYIASYMIDLNDTTYYNVAGIQINDPSIGLPSVLENVPAVPHMLNYNNIFTLNNSYVATLEGLHQSCGYAAYMEMALTFPPAGKFPAPPSMRGCSTRSLVTAAALELNPCFNIYHLTDYCPFLWDELGFPSLAMGPNNYFNQSDVQKALHVPPTNYVICGDDALFPQGDQSQPSSFVALPHVIEHTNNVIVGSGLLDYLLLTNGTLMTLNNMTWNGKQGFQTAPKDDFFVPYNPTIAVAAHGVQYQMIPPIQIGYVGGGGIMGVTHTERGLTWVTVDLAGHEIPQYVPGAAYRQLEKLLGRIPSLTAVGPFTTQGGNYTVPPPSSCGSNRRSAPAHHIE